jgi:hypothetical protein
VVVEVAQIRQNMVSPADTGKFEILISKSGNHSHHA